MHIDNNTAAQQHNYNSELDRNQQNQKITQPQLPSTEQTTHYNKNQRHQNTHKKTTDNETTKQDMTS